MKWFKDAQPVFLDGAAEPTDHVEVELLPEVGSPNTYKFYLHVNGVTIVRICKLPMKGPGTFIYRPLTLALARDHMAQKVAGAQPD